MSPAERLGAHCPRCARLVLLSRGLVAVRCAGCGGPVRADEPPYAVVAGPAHIFSGRHPALFMFTGACMVGPDWAWRFAEWEEEFWRALPRDEAARLRVPWEAAWRRLLVDPVARGAVFAAQALAPTQGVGQVYELVCLLAGQDP